LESQVLVVEEQRTTFLIRLHCQMVVQEQQTLVVAVEPDMAQLV
jgi:hypothetical protein